MRAINHSLTGAVIGLAVAEPLLAVPLAFISHFLMDAIPHHGLKKNSSNDMRSRQFNFFLAVDFILCFTLVVILLIVRPFRWPIAIICAFLAAAPDLFSINRWLKFRQNRPWKPSLYSRLAAKIQWFEKPSGLLVEGVWLVSIMACLSIFLKS